MTLKTRLVTLTLKSEREAQPLRIVGDGGIAHHAVGGGRMIPVLILDTAHRPDIDEFIRVHRHIEVGDVTVQWGQLPKHDDTVALYLRFVRPVELFAAVEFDLTRNQGVLVEQILGVRALYLQGGREGDRVGNSINAPRVVVEVPDLGFYRAWSEIYLKFTAKKIRSMGVPRNEAKRVARIAIDELRQLSDVRVRRPHNS